MHFTFKSRLETSPTLKKISPKMKLSSVGLILCALNVSTAVYAGGVKVPVSSINGGFYQVTQQNQKHISGTVIDASGQPIIGANVIEKGTTNGIMTDVDGKFTLNVSPSAILQISYLGYLTQDITVGNKNSFAVKLAEDTQNLEEVIVVGYGTQAKVNMQSSTTSM